MPIYTPVVPYPVSPFKPAAAITESYPRSGAVFSASQAALTSGQTSFTSVYLYAGWVVSSVTFVTAAQAAVTPTNQWAVLVNTSGTRLAISADDTTSAWSSTTAKTFTFSSPYTVTTEGMYYLGLMVAAATVPSLAGVTGSVSVDGIAPKLTTKDTTNTGLTTPASAPATFTLGTAISTYMYAYVS